MTNAIGKNGRYKVRVINASISTRKARKLIDTAFFSAKMDTLDSLRKVRRLCARVIREGGAE